MLFEVESADGPLFMLKLKSKNKIQIEKLSKFTEEHEPKKKEEKRVC